MLLRAFRGNSRVAHPPMNAQTLRRDERSLSIVADTGKEDEDEIRALGAEAYVCRRPPAMAADTEILAPYIDERRPGFERG